jgi:hypothetical protein
VQTNVVSYLAFSEDRIFVESSDITEASIESESKKKSQIEPVSATVSKKIRKMEVNPFM